MCSEFQLESWQPNLLIITRPYSSGDSQFFFFVEKPLLVGHKALLVGFLSSEKKSRITFLIRPFLLKKKLFDGQNDTQFCFESSIDYYYSIVLVSENDS